MTTTHRALRTVTLLLPTVALLAACGGRKEIAKAAPPPPEEIVEIIVPDLDARGSYRFEMSDGDRRLTADEFDAWMKANGIRISTGKDKVGRR